ncbi:MAG TPA: hypothetical protein VMT46_15330 [Anaerolineaceae bacterium]|nr:hypothetical protein [Anaerolineaceae bacterium]
MPDKEKTRNTPSEANLEALFEAANRDPALKKRLLANPRQVAEEYKVKLEDEDVEQLTKLGALVELADDVRFGRLYQLVDPRIFYPVSVWRVHEVVSIFRDLIPHIGYPAPDVFQGGRFSGMMRARFPNPIFYPADDTGGGFGGWHGGGWGTVFYPGVIFYPAQLLNRLEAVLAAKLAATQKTAGG